MTRMDIIIDNLASEYTRTVDDQYRHQAKQDAKQKIKNLVLEIIGEDDTSVETDAARLGVTRGYNLRGRHARQRSDIML